MLSLLILHLLILLSCTLAGFLFYRLFAVNGNRPLVMYFISGLILLTLAVQVLILIVPMNAWTQSGLFLMLFVLLLLNRRSLAGFISTSLQQIRRLPPAASICISCLWILILVINAGPTSFDDTESYHIQMVKWIREYGSVPGLVHLHSRYGFNSSWFGGIALFSIPAGKLNYFTALNATLSLVLGAYLISHIFRRKEQILAAASFVILALSLYSWPLIRGNSPASGYDFITALLILVLFIETIRSEQPAKARYNAEYIIWPAYLFTVRITNFPLLILAVMALLALWKIKPIKALAPVAFAALLIIPFLGRNAILSGYAFYPSMAMDFFTVDWKADPERTKDLIHFIKMYNRVSPQFQDITVTATQSPVQWLPLWFKYMFPFDKVLVIPGLLGLIASPFFIKRFFPSSSAATRIFVITLFAQVALWILVAPDARFLYGPLLCGSLLLFMIIFSFSGELRMVIIAATILLCIFYCGYTVYTRKSELSHTWLYPLPLPAPALQTVTVDGIKLNLPERMPDRWSARCFDTDLPCVYEVIPGLRARGTGLSDGFKFVR